MQIDIRNEIISLNGGETYLTERESDAFRVRSGALLVYAVPLRKGKPGRRSYIYTAGQGEVIPAFSYRDIEYCEWRFCLAPVGSAVIMRIPDGSTKRLRASFAEKADIKSFGREGFCGGIVDRYRLNTVTEDSFIIRTNNNRNEAAENVKALVSNALSGKSNGCQFAEHAEENSGRAYDNTACRQTVFLRKRSAAKKDRKNKEADTSESFSFRDMLSLCLKKICCKDLLKISASVISLSAFLVLLPVFVRDFFTAAEVSEQRSFGLLAVAAVIFAACISGEIINSISVRGIAQRISGELQSLVYSGVFSFRESFIRQFDSADLAGRIMRTGPCLNRLLYSAVSLAVFAFLSVVGIICACAYSLHLTAAGLLLLLPFTGLYGFFTAAAARRKKESLNYHIKSTSGIYQLLLGISKIRIAGVEDRALYEHLKSYIRELDAVEKADRLLSGRYVTGSLLSSGFTALLIAIAAMNDSNIPSGIFSGFIAAFSLLSVYIRKCVELSDIIVNEMSVLKKSLPLFGEKADLDEEGEQITDFSGAVRVENVSFSYSSSGEKTLDGINIDIKSGEYIGIAGRSGCGKSTLIRLLLGFEKPCCGKIYFDGRDIENTDKRELRRHTGVVLQDGRLISGSIAENITVTCPDADIRDIRKIAQAVGLSKDIAAMPMGYDTVLSEDCDTVSGGQRQKILIARALIGSPSLLILDEATSALDNISRKTVFDTLENSPATKIVIAHRASTLKRCDRIIVLDRGRIVEEGTFDYLLHNGKYFPDFI